MTSVKDVVWKNVVWFTGKESRELRGDSQMAIIQKEGTWRRGTLYKETLERSRQQKQEVRRRQAWSTAFRKEGKQKKKGRGNVFKKYQIQKSGGTG